jgi:hypothetical protein
MKLKKMNKEASIVLNKEAKSTVSDLPPVLRTSTTDYNKPSKPGAPSKAATPAPSKKPTKSATVVPREASKPRVVKKSPPRRTKPRSGYSTAVGKVKKAHKAIGSPGSLPVKGSGGGVVFNIPFQEGAAKLKKIIEEELEDLINEGSGDIAFVDRHGKPRKPAKVTVPEPEAKGDTDLTQKMIKQRDKDNPVKKIQQLAKATPKQIKKAKPKRKRHEKLGRRKAGDPLPKKRRLRRNTKTGKLDPKGTILPTDKRGLEEAYKHTSTKDILNIQENIMKNKQYTSFEKEQKIFVHWREYLNEETVRGDREKAQRADQLKNAPHQKVPGVKPKKAKESLSRSLVESSMPGYFLEEISDAVEDYIYEFIKYPRRTETDDVLDKVHQQLNKPTEPEKPKCKSTKKCKYVVKIKKTKEKLKEYGLDALGAASTVADAASTAKNISKGKFKQAAKSAAGLVPAVGAVKAGADFVGAGIKAGQQAAKRVVPKIVSQRAPTNIKQRRRLAKHSKKTDAALTAPTKAATATTHATGKIPQSSLARGIYNVFLKEYLKAAIEEELETEL